MMSSVCTLRLKRRSALSRLSPSWMCTSANRNSPASRILYESQDNRCQQTRVPAMPGVTKRTGPVCLWHLGGGAFENLSNPTGVGEAAAGERLQLLFHVILHAADFWFVLIQ